MKAFLVAVALAAGLTAPAAAASWSAAAPYFSLQGQKGQQGQGPRRADPGPGRDQRFDRRDRPDDRRERLNEDERKALHRDLDKANRELYRHRYQK